MTGAPSVAALVIDACVGEMPPVVHPVVWMGRVLDWLEARAPTGRRAQFVYGVGVALGLPLAWGSVGWGLERLMPWPVQALGLKATFAGRALLDAARRVEDALRADRLDQARAELRWLVSRPTADLDAELVAAAAIESLAENFVDSWLAPLLAYALVASAGRSLTAPRTPPTRCGATARSVRMAGQSSGPPGRRAELAARPTGRR